MDTSTVIKWKFSLFHQQSLELLPSTTKMSEILAYLENVMEHQAMIRRKNQVLKSMLYAENLQVNSYTVQFESKEIHQYF